MSLVPQRKILAGEVDPQYLLQFSHNIESTQLRPEFSLTKKTALTSGEIDLSKAGVISKTADNINETAARKYFLSAERTKLTGVETGADVTSGHTAANASAYTGAAISTAYTAAKCTDALADQTSVNQSATVASLAGRNIGELADTATFKRLPYASSKYDLSGSTSNITHLEAAHTLVETASSTVPIFIIYTRILKIEEGGPGSAITGFGEFYCTSANKAYFQDGDGVSHEIAFV